MGIRFQYLCDTVSVSGSFIQVNWLYFLFFVRPSRERKPNGVLGNVMWQDALPVLEYERATPVANTAALSGDDRNKGGGTWFRWRADRSPVSADVRKLPAVRV